MQSLNLKGKLSLDLAVQCLPGSDGENRFLRRLWFSCSAAPVLAIGCTDRRIQIWTRRDGVVSVQGPLDSFDEQKQFHHALSLEGHEDWIRCLAFTPYPSESSSTTSDLLLASGSQDNLIRLWRVSAITDTLGGDDGLDMLDDFERKLVRDSGGSTQISTKAHILAIHDGDR